MNRIATILLFSSLCGLMACTSKPSIELPYTGGQESVSFLSTNNDSLAAAYQWACSQALAYSHDGTDLRDSVGPWYEAALPGREAFCMRDVSHQCVAASMLGLSPHNLNMMHRFAENISESKDWCTYWEINRYNRPAPADYRNDREFWYNLPANFDVIQACLKLYDWTVDDRYLTEPVFTHFYEATFHRYLPHWRLQADSLLMRPMFLHAPQPIHHDDAFHVCRGLASYVEGWGGVTASLDLAASLYAGHKAYARMLAIRGEADSATVYAQRADEYRRHIDTNWWDEANHRFHTLWVNSCEFRRGEGVPFMLWFDATAMPERIRSSMDDILAQEWNVENLSHQPTLFYRLGYDEAAYDKLFALSTNARKAYPEASYGFVEGVVGGYMGITPDASTHTVATRMHGPTTDATRISDIPLWGGMLTVQHEGHTATTLTNHTGSALTWQATFYGRHNRLRADGRRVASGALTTGTDVKGNDYTTATLSVPDGATMTVRCAD